MTINTIKKHSPLRGLGALFLLFALPSMAQDGGISPEMLAKTWKDRYKIQYRDPKAEHTQPEIVRPLLDVLQYERAPFTLRT